MLTLAGGLSAALVFGYITQRLGCRRSSATCGRNRRRSVHAGVRRRRGIAEQLAEVGVILLMFGVGLQFHLDELLAVRRVAIPGAIAQSAVATVLGAVIARGVRLGLVRPASSSAWPSPWPAPSCSSACWPTTATCTRPPATSPSAGWSSKTCSRSSRSCCCRRCSAAASATSSRWRWRSPRSRWRRSSSSPSSSALE